MPSSAKSKKQSKSAASRLSADNNTCSSPSVSSSSKNPDGEFTEQELLQALQEASRRFPSLISESAFIGTISETSSASASAAALDKGACKIWLSESAMLAANITPASIVSVSLASSSKFSSSFLLSSLAFECAKHFGFDFEEDLADEAGSYFTLATAFPSCKVSKNAVRLSSNLSCAMGFPHSGRTIFVYPLRIQPQAGIVNGNDKLHGAPAGYFSLLESKELYLSLVNSKGKFTANSTKSSDVDFPIETNAQFDNRVISSPKTPLRSQSKLSSSGSGQLSTPGFRGSMTVAPDLNESSSNGLDIREILEDDAPKKLLQTCTVLWLNSRNLLSGNFVVIPITSRLLVFQVTDGSKVSANSNSQNLADKTSHEFFLFTVGQGTKVQISLLESHEPQSPDRRSLSCTEREHRNSKADFSELGGLSKEFAVLKDIIVSSTVKNTLASMGLRPTKGVLLHGPPGTGKTFLARLCAQAAAVKLFSVNGPEIVSQYYGESEQALLEVFDSATRAAPAVVFIDELDAIAPARKDGGEELSQRMVATLLNLMDGISRTDGLLVIAATNRPDSIEPALRRPGRLDREIELGVPSPKQRYEILHALLSEMEHSLSDMDIQHLATATHGFVGADLAALCNEAALVCLRRYVDSEVCASLDSQQSTASPSCSGDVDSSSRCLGVPNGLSVKDNVEETFSSILELNSSSDTLNGIKVNRICNVEEQNLKVAFEDFEKARMRVRPSAMREVILEVPKVSWEDVGGLREVKMQLMEAVEWPQKHQDAFRRIGTRPPTGVLMFGPPGCSKTLLARAVASESGLNFLAVKGPELFSKWVGESEKAVRSLFAKARANAPSIIFFDEIDGLAVIRGKESDGVSVADRVMSQLLIELDGLHQRVNVTVIAATNRPDKIDPALLRPGRFDRLLYVGPPNGKDREDIFRVCLHKIPCSSDVCIEELALLTEGFTGADISLVCREAAIAAMEESLDASEITMKHLKAGIKQLQPSEIQSYQKLSTKFQRLVRSTAEEDDQSSQVHPGRSFHSPLRTIIRSIAHFFGRFSASLLQSDSSSIR